MKSVLKIVADILHTLKDLIHLHKYAKDILHGSFQFTVVLYLFSAVVYFLAPITPDYMLSISYYEGAWKIAPVIMAGGIVSALLCDLVMRKTQPEQKKNDTSDKDNDE